MALSSKELTGSARKWMRECEQGEQVEGLDVRWTCVNHEQQPFIYLHSDNRSSLNLAFSLHLPFC